jgi:hypothetical protein
MLDKECCFAEVAMIVRARPVVLFLLFSVALGIAADDKKPALPLYVLRAQTVFVMIDPDAGTSPASPTANQKARDEVEKALMKWGRFRLVMQPGEADLIVVVRKGSGKVVQPTIGGLPTNDRPVIVQPTDTGIRLGGQKGRPAGSNDPAVQNPQPGPQVEVGAADDMLVVYHGGAGNPLDGPAAWRYVDKNALKSPNVPAVAEFRKAIEEAEKQQQKNKP